MMSFSAKPARYLGYGGGFGEAVSPLVDNDIVRALYTVGALFVVLHVVVVMLDTGDVVKVLDTLLFELIASAVIPTAVGHFVVRLTDKLLVKLGVSNDIRDYVPTVMAVMCLLVLVDPLDKATNDLLDMTFRKVKF